MNLFMPVDINDFFETNYMFFFRNESYPKKEYIKTNLKRV